MQIIAVTGRMGSGKSLVCQQLASWGAHYVHADLEARRIMEQDPAVVAFVRSHFGSDAYDASGALIPSVLAPVLFANEAKRKAIEAMVHPRVTEALMATLLDLRSRDPDDQPPALVYEAALFGERPSWPSLAEVWLVSAPLSHRQARAQATGITLDVLQARDAAQPTDEQQRRFCDREIVNDGSLAHLTRKTRAAWDAYLSAR